MDKAKLLGVWRDIPLPFKLAIIFLLLALSTNGILGTISTIQTVISHARDRRVDEREQRKDAEIDNLLKQADDLRKEVQSGESEKKALRVELQAKDEIIAQAGGRLEARANAVEEIKNELQKETDRIDALDDPDAISRELRARLKARGLLKE